MDMFGRNIAAFRKARNLTQTQLAKDLYVSHQAVSKWERGQSLPDAEMLMNIARYCGVTVDQLLNQEMTFTPPVYAEPLKEVLFPQVTEKAEEETIPRRKNPMGVLCVIPMLVLVAWVLLLPVAQAIIRSFTDYNAIQAPVFIGLTNHINLFFQDEKFSLALKNTCKISLLLLLTVGTTAFLMWKLIRRSHKALRWPLLFLWDGLAIFVLAGGYTFLFSGDAYGPVNGYLLSHNKITESIPFLTDPQTAGPILLRLMGLAMLGPVLTVLSLLKTRKVAANGWRRLLFPLKSSMQVYAAGGLPVLLLPFCWRLRVETVGAPAPNYLQYMLIDHFMDYGTIRYELGYAALIAVVSLMVQWLILLLYVVLSCLAMHGVVWLKTRIRSALVWRKWAANLSAGVLLAAVLVLFFPLYMTVMNSFKEVSELFLFPPRLLPEKLYTGNYDFLFAGNAWAFKDDFGVRLLLMLVFPLVPAVSVAAVSGTAALGVGYFEYKARPWLYGGILLSFLLLPCAALPNITRLMPLDNSIAFAFFAAFFSAAPLIGFLYTKAAVERAQTLSRSAVAAAALAGIPVTLITYVLCFLNQFESKFLYSAPGFTLDFFFQFSAGGIARAGTDAASKCMALSVIYGFFLLAAVSAVLVFPRTPKKPKSC